MSVLALLGKQGQIEVHGRGHHVGAVTAVGIVTETFSVLHADVPAGFVLFPGCIYRLLTRFELGVCRLDGGVLLQAGTESLIGGRLGQDRVPGAKGLPGQVADPAAELRPLDVGLFLYTSPSIVYPFSLLSF